MIQNQRYSSICRDIPENPRKSRNQWFYIVWKKQAVQSTRGVGYFIKDTNINFCTVEPDNNTTTEILWIKLKLKMQEKLFIGVLNGKQKRKHCKKEL